ncbi:MAG: hypothetical protein AAGA90_02750 [Actinomycetota bacterium]
MLEWIEEDGYRGIEDFVERPLLQHEFDALIALIYNGGPRTLGGMPTLLRLINEGSTDALAIREDWDFDIPDAAWAASDSWISSDGAGCPNTTSRGQCGRRSAEALMFLEGIYSEKR